ncbi:2-oxoglutarate ferredoxin oxidoreductase subunit delta, partial [Dysosmobacter welbionis]
RHGAGRQQRHICPAPHRTAHWGRTCTPPTSLRRGAHHPGCRRSPRPKPQRRYPAAVRPCRRFSPPAGSACQ